VLGDDAGAELVPELLVKLRPLTHRARSGGFDVLFPVVRFYDQLEVRCQANATGNRGSFCYQTLLPNWAWALHAVRRELTARRQRALAVRGEPVVG
jgi:hypothetical protein